jgi:hypothetical protein
MKTSELTGAALDWAVAICETPNIAERLAKKRDPQSIADFQPSTNWTQAGPIIEREKITITPVNGWQAGLSKGGIYYTSGPTPLIAAMRCYVASKLGAEIEIPKELT